MEKLYRCCWSIISLNYKFSRVFCSSSNFSILMHYNFHFRGLENDVNNNKSFFMFSILKEKKKHESSQTLRTATRKEKNLVNNFFHFTSRHWNYLSNNFSMLFFFVWLLKRCFSANKLYLMSYKNMLQGWQRKLLRWHEKMLQELLIKCPTDILLMRFFHGKFKNKSRKEKNWRCEKKIFCDANKISEFSSSYDPNFSYAKFTTLTKFIWSLSLVRSIAELCLRTTLNDINSLSLSVYGDFYIIKFYNFLCHCHIWNGVKPKIKSIYFRYFEACVVCVS